MTAATLCPTCGTEALAESARFCHACGSPLLGSDTPAEYKQVTVLFADVVHSMDIAAAVGAERLREIMTDLVNRAAGVVQRYGGTVDFFPAFKTGVSHGNGGSAIHPPSAVRFRHAA